MTTTALFAEILVVGLLALPWILLASLSAAGVQLPATLNLGPWEGVGIAEVLAFAYAAGIVVDRLADALFDPWDEALSLSAREARKANAPPAPEYPDRALLRFRLMASSPAIAMEFLDYARSRRRILRGIALNSALTIVVAIVELIVGQHPIPGRAMTVLAIGAAITAAGALLAWWHIGKMYFHRSLVAYDAYVK